MLSNHDIIRLVRFFSKIKVGVVKWVFVINLFNTFISVQRLMTGFLEFGEPNKSQTWWGSTFYPYKKSWWAMQIIQQEHRWVQISLNPFIFSTPKLLVILTFLRTLPYVLENVGRGNAAPCLRCPLRSIYIFYWFFILFVIYVLIFLTVINLSIFRL
jgi:hypothetical protein